MPDSTDNNSFMEVGVTNLGENLIFLISQPRAGSTLLQRILSNHPEVHSISEPWLMLHPLYQLKNDGYEAEYNARWAFKAFQGFLSELPKKEETYIDAVRLMYGFLYNKVLLQEDAIYFLDKTPRYYFIISELYNVFPEAKYIFLFRNPLDVLTSILNTWVNYEWRNLRYFSHDLFDAPDLLLKGRNQINDQSIVVHYETLVQEPKATLQTICSKLGLNYYSGFSNYGMTNMPMWDYGDKKIYTLNKPEPSNAGKWLDAAGNPQYWRLLNEYLEILGREKTGLLGYDFGLLKSQLNEKKPPSFLLVKTVSLKWLLSTKNKQGTKWEKAKFWATKLIQHRP